MAVVDKNTIELAIQYQQVYYELLPDWFQYDFEDYQLIKHKIGYALFGPPKLDNDVGTLSNNLEDNTFNSIMYDKMKLKVIDKIYNKIIQYGKSKQNSIYIGIIFNVIFLHQVSKESKEKDKLNNPFNLCVLPIFKLRKDAFYTWYMDNEGRIYKSWQDYITNNTLPQCTMVLPKRGLYQHDPSNKITKYSSTVWVEVLNSPACAIKNKIFKGMDIATSTLSICTTVGLGVASVFTPVAPALLTAGLIYNAANASWIIGRSSQKLIDLATHKQSINPIDKNAFPTWFNIGSTALTVGASGGTMLVSKTLANYNTIGDATKMAYKSLMLSSLTINGIGLVYQGYCLIDKYQMEREVDIADVLIFTSHVLFFSNIVINTKLGCELIETSRGTIFQKFKNALRFNRFETQFNYQNVENQCEGIVHKITKGISKNDFLGVLNKMRCGKVPTLTYQDGNIVINNNIFIDPIIFTRHLLTAGVVAFNLIESNSSVIAAGKHHVLAKLKTSLQHLLRNFYTEKQPDVKVEPDVDYFNNILQEIKYMNNAEEVLIKLFKIAVIIVKHCNNPQQFLFDSIYFSWMYCKANLREYVTVHSTPISKMFSVLSKIVTFLFDCIDAIEDELFSAFYTYIITTNAEVCN